MFNEYSPVCIISGPTFTKYLNSRCSLSLKAGVPLPDFKEFDDIGVDERNRMQSCLLRSHPIFRSHCPTDRIRFLLSLSHNAFRAMTEMNNRMRSIRSSLTCQSPSNSIRFFKIASNRLIVHSHCPIFPPIFPSIRQTIK